MEEDKITQIIQLLTLEEKVSLCSGGTDWSTQAIERLDIPEVFMTDGPHGVRWFNPELFEEGFEINLAIFAELNPESEALNLLIPATCFPTATTLASTWDVDLLNAIGVALGRESHHFGIGILLGPGINIKRSPLTGRNFEYFSEDPVLAGELASAYVKGVQREGVGTSVKHFVCNNAEFERTSMSSEVDERALREIYLAAFERVVKGAKPWTVMSSYNRINGIDASNHTYLLTEVLKNEWGFDGVVISDWWAVKDRPTAANAGLDLEMPGGPGANPVLMEAVNAGLVDEATIDGICRRILQLVFKAAGGRRPGITVDFDAHHKLSRQAAAEGMVLLKNEEQLLPLDPDAGNHIAVIGQMAVSPRYQGEGSSLVNPIQLTKAFDEIKLLAGSNTRISYNEGYDNDQTNQVLLDKAISAAKTADAAILFVGLPNSFEAESSDRTHMDMPESHVSLIGAVSRVQKNTVVVLRNGSCANLNPWIEKAPAVLEGWLGGGAGGSAVADVLFGKINPCGKLPVTIPYKLSDTPSYLNFPGENGKHHYNEGVFVGYRYYDTKEVEPLFPFGFGLSYTRFEYSDLSLSSQRLTDLDTLRITFRITNTGSRFGKEVAQIYVSDHESRLKRPLKELKAFQKVALEPGASQIVSLDLVGRDFAYYDPRLSRWVVESGKFDILVGKSSRDIHLCATIDMDSTQNNYIPLTKDSYFKDVLQNEKAVEIFIKFLIKHGALPPDVTPDMVQGLRNIFVQLGVARDFTGGRITAEMLDDVLSEINQAVQGSSVLK